jgi:hypothetical protein
MESVYTNRKLVGDHNNSKKKRDNKQEEVIASLQLYTLDCNFKCDYVVSKNSKLSELDCHDQYGNINEITINSHRSSCEIVNSEYTITYDIGRLASLYEAALVQSRINENTLWKFSYIDQNIAKIDLQVEKINKNNLLVTLSTSDYNYYKINKLINRLHFKLNQKGWINQIEHINNRKPLDKASELTKE